MGPVCKSLILNDPQSSIRTTLSGLGEDLGVWVSAYRPQPLHLGFGLRLGIVVVFHDLCVVLLRYGR